MASNLTVTMPDRPGLLAQLGEALGQAGVNIRGGCAVTTDGQGWAHILVDDAAAATAAIEGAGMSVSSEREVLTVDVQDHPGELGGISRKLADAGVNIELFYLTTGMELVFVVDDTEKARAAL